MRFLLSLGLAIGLGTIAVIGVPPGVEKKKSDGPEPKEALALAKAPEGLKVSVWAAEPLLENPVSFCFDEKGVCYVAETTRFDKGVPDTRGHMNWLDEDIGARTVEDRLAMYKKHNYKGFEDYDDTVRKVWDAEGKGVATASSVFAKGFNQMKDGLGAGVLARKGDVFYTCIPDLYKLKDTKGKDTADKKESLFTGFGVRAQFLGHDLHGLRMGPDGKLYFSIGDRGFTVTTKEGKVLSNPDSGAVLRCQPDGSNLEIVHTGLRNPQELAFDNHGNLFTYDNNSDSGDQARWVYIIEGGDSGWRCGYQYGTLFHNEGVLQGNRGPWNTEKLWHTAFPHQPAYVLPPLKHFGNGPSGITHYPGLGLNSSYDNHFFACDFTANPGNSVIWSLALKPKGAAFEVENLKPFIKNMVPTDCEFGPDGAFYWLDWVGGWSPPNRGRIFKVTDPEAMKDPRVEQARKLLAEGFEKKTTKELCGLLSFAHQQVRQEAQYELMARGRDSISPLIDVAFKGKNQLERLHAIWALGAIQKVTPGVAIGLGDLAKDKDSIIRGQAIKVMGDIAEWKNVVQDGLTDVDARVKLFAVEAYGKTYAKPQWRDTDFDYLKPLFAFLKTNNNEDAYLRNAAAHALSRVVDKPCDILAAFEKNKAAFDTPAVRLGIVLALRKLQCPRLGDFLADTDADVASEAARAIHDDSPIMPALEALAKRAELNGQPEALVVRALSANFKLGDEASANRVAGYAARSSEPAYLRTIALKLLADWAKPSKRDYVTGMVQTLPERDATPARTAMAARVKAIFTGPTSVWQQAAKTGATLNVNEVRPFLAEVVMDVKQNSDVRVEALYTLKTLKDAKLDDYVTAALTGKDDRLRAAARVVKAQANPTQAAKEIPALLNDSKVSVVEKQTIFAAIPTLRPAKALDEALAQWMDDLIAGKVPNELKLEVIEAATERSVAKGKDAPMAPLMEKLTAYDKQIRAGVAKDPLSRWRDVIHGGDAAKGKEIFVNNAAVYCQRCHKVQGQGGEVGPELTGIGGKQTRDYLTEALIDPNKVIAKGFESVILTKEDGRIVAGVLRSKTDKEYVVVDAEGKVFKVAKEDVASERPDKSAMPEDLFKKLSRREIRDLVEYLATVK